MNLTAGLDASGRLDQWLAKALPEFTRSRLQALIRNKSVLLNGKPTEPSCHVKPGYTIDIELPPKQPTEIQPDNIPLSILYEDSDVLVLNKQAGLVVHPAAGHSRGTLVNAVLHHCHDIAGIGGEDRPGIVHRLDKDTSGVMVVAKSDAAMNSLVSQFQKGEVHKEYLAIIRGKPPQAQGSIQTLIGRDPSHRKRMAVTTTHGKTAETSFHLEEYLPPYSLIRVRIHTGRTHQIRVHMAHLGCPVVGDRTYGGRKSGLHHAEQSDRVLTVPSRQLLHAETLGFRLPTSGEYREFHAPLPDDMKIFLAQMRLQS